MHPYILYSHCADSSFRPRESCSRGRALTCTVRRSRLPRKRYQAHEPSSSSSYSCSEQCSRAHDQMSLHQTESSEVVPIGNQTQSNGRLIKVEAVARKDPLIYFVASIPHEMLLLEQNKLVSWSDRLINNFSRFDALTLNMPML